jgi:cyclophilin family peptidyl-prolyl cis-trans isomerase
VCAYLLYISLSIILLPFKSEYFINLKDNSNLDRSGSTGWALGFAVWGEVVEGMDVAEKISKLPTVSKNGMKMLDQGVTFNIQLLP